MELAVIIYWGVIDLHARFIFVSRFNCSVNVKTPKNAFRLHRRE